MSVSKIATTAATTTEVKNTNPETHSLVSTAFSREPTPTSSGPTKLGGNKDQRKQSEEKGNNNTSISTVIFSVQFTFSVIILCHFIQSSGQNKLKHTVAHIGHQYISFRIYIYNSGFHRKNPTCVHFKIYNSDFHYKNPSCQILKCTTQVFTAEIRVVNIVEFVTRIFTTKI